MNEHSSSVTYHVKGKHLADGCIGAALELFLSRRLALERKRHRRVESALDLLLLVCPHTLLLQLVRLLILVVGPALESCLVSRHVLDLAVAWRERLVRALVGLRERPVDGESQLVAAVVDELTLDVVLGFTLGCTLPAVALSVFCHRTDHSCALRVDQGRTVRRNVRARRIVGHLELALFVIQVPDSLFLVTRGVLEGGSVA